MAANMGVNIAAFPAGSNLSQLKGQVGMALGTGSLTVNEQATMLSTIDNGGTYHQAHVIQSWQSPEGTVRASPRGDAPGPLRGPRLAGPVRDGDDHRQRNGHRRVARP